jgi:(2Fe-2S) ferredoxin
MTKENIGALVESHLVNGKPLEDLVITKNPLPRD